MDFNPNLSLEEIERLAILHRMQWCRNNKTQTASSLGIAIRTLDAKLEKYGNENDKRAADIEQERIRNAAILARMRGITPEAFREAGSAINGSVSPGPRLESITNAPAQQSLPMSESEKVQELLPAKHAQGGQKRRG